MKRILSTIAAVAIGALTLIPGEARADVRVGTLVCDISGGAGYILASRKVLGCDFNRLGGPNEFYNGSITKVGVDVGITTGTRLIWAVFAPSLSIDTTALEGHYFGVTAEATPGVGIGANVLIGGFDRSINLQPISVQGQTGANVAAGVAALRLTSAPTIVIKR